MSLLDDEIKPTPRNYLLGLLADAAQKVNETVSRPGGYDNPPARMLMSLLGVPAIAQTLDRLSYGEPLTTGRGMTTKMRPEVTEALLSVAPGVGPAAKATGKAAKSVAPKAAQMAEQYMFKQGLAKPIIVWHGSPHKFDKFDASKIGTGEGAQAYGHGLYVAESPGVASQYAENVKDMDTIRRINNEMSKLADIMARDEIPGAYRKYKTDAGREAAKRYDELMESRESVRKAPGQMYKIDLPDEQIARMLDWDKPLSQQASEVQEALSKLGYKYDAKAASAHDDALLGALMGDSSESIPKMPLDPMGSEIARGKGIFDRPQDKVIAEKLRSAGIPGIRYLDQGSRSAGQGTSNFVIFPGEESILKILERNGIPIESLL